MIDWKTISTAECAMWAAPFAVYLFCIATLPLAAGKFWEHNRNKAIVAALFGLPVIGLFVYHREFEKLRDSGLDYVAFISLLASLYIISGGILLRGELSGTPLVNTMFLAIGAVFANVIGTTGASMLLIRPLLRANAKRRRVAHIVIFFIFLVSNCGGCLTPLGDPPLYLGFIQGVPFEWTFRLVLPWLFMVGCLLVIFNMLDQMIFTKEDIETPGALTEQVQSPEPLRIDGKANIVLLLGIVGAIVGAGQAVKHHALDDTQSKIAQAGVMLMLALASLRLTEKKVRQDNGFSYGPIIEVAVVFAGIFAAMMPALIILKERGGALGVTKPWQYFLASGSLSSVLDNAPTYLTFLSLAQGSGGAPEVVGVPHVILTGIALGSVFMGANTYIGNGPNFMVRSIAESAGVKMPNFFAYVGWAAVFLWPLFAAVAFIFLR